MIERVFTLQQINHIHETLGSADTLLQYLRALKAIGVDTYDSYLIDGHSEYYGQNGHHISSPPIHKVLVIAPKANREKLLEHLDLHNQHKTNYLEMSQGLADSGIEKWTFDTNAMTLAYYDKAGNEIYIESIQKDK